MTLYRTTIVRSYAITIESDSEDDAARLAEFFVGFADFSNHADRKQHNFEIKKIELLENDAINTTPITP